MLPFILPTMLLVAEARAANPCAGVDVVEDKFTHATTAKVWGTSWPVAPGGVFLRTPWQAVFENGASRLEVELQLGGVHSEVLPSGHKVLLLMKDDSVYELVTTADTQPTPASPNGALMTIWPVHFVIDKSTAAKLSGQQVASVRTTLPGGDLTWTFGAPAKEFMRAFACYASLMP